MFRDSIANFVLDGTVFSIGCPSDITGDVASSVTLGDTWVAILLLESA